MSALEEKEFTLRSLLRSYEKLAVAFSGGVDSTFLLHIAHEELGSNVQAFIASIPLMPTHEFKEACTYCKAQKISFHVCTPAVLDLDEVRTNASNRCYVCKKAIFGSMKKAALDQGFTGLADGTNCDDMGDYRPGLQALEELAIESPLKEAGFTKHDIRDLSKELGLSTWNRQSNACLATRFPYGEHINIEKLSVIEKGEAFLQDLGFEPVRLRSQGSLARIEVSPQQIVPLCSDPLRTKVFQRIKELGYTYVTVDLEGFRSGSMNEVINSSDKGKTYE